VKGIAFNTIIYATLALVAVVILVLILNTLTSNFLGKSFCRFYKVILSLPLPKQLKPEIPGCSVLPAMERFALTEEMCRPEILKEYIENCWEKSEEGKSGLTFICYEIFMEKIKNPFNGEDVTTSIDDKIDWKIERIEGEELTIIVKYNPDNNKVEVI